MLFGQRSKKSTKRTMTSNRILIGCLIVFSIAFAKLSTDTFMKLKLSKAVEVNDVLGVKQCMDYGVSPNGRIVFSEGLLALIFHFGDEPATAPLICFACAKAYETGQTQVLELLLKHGADPNSVDPDGRYPLIYYSVLEKHPNKDIIRLLVKYGVKAKQRLEVKLINDNL